MPGDYFVCKTCHKKVYYSDGYEKRNALQPKRLIAVRRHYKKKHPGKFRAFIKKGVRARRRKSTSNFL